jgi:ABC-type phosphate transport system auxiliary subunit
VHPLDLEIDDDLDISFSELRDADAVMARLEATHRLRVRRRGATIGLLLDPEALQAMKAEFAQLQERVAVLQAELDARDDEELAALCSARLAGDGEPVVSGSAESADAVVRHYREAMAVKTRGKRASR